MSHDGQTTSPCGNTACVTVYVTVRPAACNAAEHRFAVPLARQHWQSADAQNGLAGVRRCLLNDFTLAAEAEQWQLLSLEQEQAQAASSPMPLDGSGSMQSPPRPRAPEDCMTSPQALMMSASPNDAWQPGRLREVMQVSDLIRHSQNLSENNGPLHSISR